MKVYSHWPVWLDKMPEAATKPTAIELLKKKKKRKKKKN
jgi:hypothetical protein